jgi:hypothetical protein
MITHCNDPIAKAAAGLLLELIAMGRYGSST